MVNKQHLNSAFLVLLTSWSALQTARTYSYTHSCSTSYSAHCVCWLKKKRSARTWKALCHFGILVKVDSVCALEKKNQGLKMHLLIGGLSFCHLSQSHPHKIFKMSKLETLNFYCYIKCSCG